MVIDGKKYTVREKFEENGEVMYKIYGPGGGLYYLRISTNGAASLFVFAGRNSRWTKVGSWEAGI